MPVELQIAQQLREDAGALPQAEQFDHWARAALAQVNRPESIDLQEICIRITDSEEVRDLNARYRHQDKPTNVLSFPAEFPGAAAMLDAAEPLPLGDLVLSLPIVVAEASAQNKSLNDHMAHLVMHGTLHLLGYDHEAEEDAELMESIEVAALSECGIGNPYADESGAGA